MHRTAAPRLALAACLTLFAPGSLADAQAPAPGADLLDRAKAALAATDYRAAGPLFTQALAAADGAHDDARAAAALRGLAVAQWGLGDYQGALKTQDRALALSRARGDLDGERTALNGTGLDQYSLGNYPDALRNYRLALDVDKASPSEKFQGLVWANIGLVYRYQGKFDEALVAFATSLDLRRKAVDAAGVAQTLNHLGIVSRAMGRHQRAIEFYEQSLAERRRVGDRQGEAQTLNNLGNVLSDMGDYNGAIERYAESLRVAEAIGYSVQRALASANIGAALSQLGRPREALARDEAALAIYRTLSRRSQIVEGLRNIGELHIDLAALPQARAPLEESLALAREIGEPESQALALRALGRLEVREGHLDAALARLDAAVALTSAGTGPEVAYQVRTDRGIVRRLAKRPAAAIEDLRAAAALVTDMRARLTSDLGKIGFLDRRTDVFLALAGALMDADLPGDALEAAESGRARAMADLLSARQTATKPAERSAFSSLREAMAAEPAAATGSGAVAGAVSELRAANGELASLVSVESPRLDEVRGIAARLHATLVEYLAEDHEVLIWTVAPDGVLHAARSPVEFERLESDARALREGRLPRQVLRRLHRELIAPIEAWLPRRADDPVVIVPEGPLTFVPFAALTDATGVPVIARHTLAFAPSVSVFRYTPAKIEAGGAIRGGRALIVADPQTAPSARLSPLPGARLEARAIERLLGAGRTRLLVGTAATEASVKAESGRYGILHFATHGLVSVARPLASSLALAGGDGEDGYLRVDEVFGMDLRARLVVLSGCATGLGRGSGDGVLGLARAFIYAGTPDVIATQWDLSDRGAAGLMTHFYAALQKGAAVSVALRRAQLWARARHADPALWAPFMLVGEP